MKKINYIIIVSTGLFTLFLFAFLAQKNIHKNWELEQQKEKKRIISMVERRSNEILEQLNSIQSFVEVSSEDNLTQEKFVEFAKQVTHDNEKIYSISWAPDGIQTYVYPYDEEILGHNLYLDERESVQTAISEAIRTLKPQISGPYPARQNPDINIVVFRYPVFFEDRELRGFVNIVMESENLFIPIQSESYSNIYDYHVVNSNGQILFGNQTDTDEIFSLDNNVFGWEIHLSLSEEHLAEIQRTKNFLNLTFFGSIFFIGLYSFLTFKNTIEQSKELQKQKHALEKSNQKLEAQNQELDAYNQQLKATEQQLRAEVEERKQAEEQSKERRMMLERTIDRAPVPIMLHAEDGEVIKINETWTDITGYSPEEIPTIYKWAEKAYGDRKEKVMKTIESLHEKKDKTFEGEFEIKTKSGEKRTWDFKSVYIGEIPDGRSLVISLARDITENKEKEKKLQKNRKFLEQILETSPVGIVVLNQAGEITRVNGHFLDIFNLTREEVESWGFDGERWSNFDEEVEPFPVEELPFARVLEEGKPVFGVENAVERPDGEKIWLSISMAPTFDKDGQLIQAVGALEDITGRRKMESDLRQSIEEKKVMLKEIHHRVKNNLQVICSLLEMRARTAPSEAERPLMETRNRVHSMALIHDRIYQSDTPSAVNIENYLEELIAGLKNTYEREELEIKVELEVDEFIQLGLDRAVPCALILNEILANAFEHAFPTENEKENFVRISFQKNSSEFDFCLRISDNGQGLPEDYEIGGLGQGDTLGLGLIKALAEQQLAGQLEVNSSSNEGTEFVVEF